MHVYASLQEAKNYAADEGIAWGAGSTNDALALSILESVSRHIDWWCRRSRTFGSGFGPRIGTNTYDSTGGASLHLHDDLLETTEIVARASTGSGVTTNPEADTDFFLINNDGGYDVGPYRLAQLHGNGTAVWPFGMRVIEWTGIWGYSNVTVPLASIIDGAIDDEDTIVVVDDFTGISAGHTLLIEDEQVYVSGIAYTMGVPVSLTVVRATNGTTAASHDDDTELARYVYDSRVVEATQRVWFKRWIARNAAADGSDGGGQTGTVWPRESEDTILRREIGDLRLMGRVAFGRARTPVRHGW